ncbi:MAG: cytochrome c3 family protein [Nitrospirae bacterium]|nr:cytochrome c3 family protein [Nitrospirota bacterium]
MKKLSVLVLIVVFSVFATVAFATIANTKHNLTATGGSVTRTNDASATLCGFCHLPHGGNTSQAGLPLWARSMPTATYQTYGAGAGGTTLNGTAVGVPGTFSKTCLSCHDGTIGLGTITKNGITKVMTMTSTLPGGLAANALQATNIDPANGYSPYIGTDLRNDHPVGFTFPAAPSYGATGGKPGIGLTPTVDAGGAPALQGFTSGQFFPLFMGSNQFECATCHDPHLENSGSTQTKFLRAPNAGFCQDCHNLK